jgi:hypothetical protein
MKAIVTQESLQAMLDNPNREFVERVIGRALVALLNRQTCDEQATNETRVHNNIGFTGADGRSGTLTAKSFLKRNNLADWQVERWLKKGKNGYSRLTKYARQLNEIANEKIGESNV